MWHLQNNSRSVRQRPQTDRVVHVLLPEERVRWEHQIHIKLAHVRNCHPELLQKIKDKKNEQSLERRAQRNERRRKSQRNAVEEDEDEVELEE
ncbi:hypothetical protein ACLKA6_012623 [Drosophila palustris]